MVLVLKSRYQYQFKCERLPTLVIRYSDKYSAPTKFPYNGQGTLTSVSFQHVLPQIGFKNMEGVQHVPLTQEKAVQLVKDVFISAAERDVYTGDALRVCIITKEGISEQTVPLRKD